MYFLANNSKILSSYRSADSSFSSHPRTNACPVRAGQRSGFGSSAGQRSKVGAAWSQFSGGHVFLSFPMCPSLVRASTRGRRPGSAGGRLWTFEKAARARLAKARANGGTEISLSLFHRSFPSSSNLARSAPSIFPVPARVRVRVRV